MQQKALRILTAFLCILSMGSAYSVGPVFDEQNFIRMGELLREAKAQYEELQAMKSEMERVKKTLGSDSTVLNRSMALDFERYLADYASINIDSLSVLNWLNYKNSSKSLDDLPTAIDFIEKTFFPKDLNHTKWEDRAKTNKVREEASKRSTVAGVAISAKSKHSLAGSQKKIASLGLEGANAADILSALRANNKLLSVVATELVQQRELLSHHLEIISTRQASELGTLDLTAKPSAAFK